ncbi:MAG: 30S ribosomal protein S6 [Candidatus Borkfalkiaceae bacterium]|mgnify:FL=1|nr:30S ribosomal protein S6 [Christensenellaceae bacterium]
MTKYEMLYILSTKLTDEAKDQIIAKFEGIVTGNGGTVEKTDKWGVRKLAYTINKTENEGFYVLMTFECETSLIKELTRVSGITEGMLRQMITKRA